MTGQELTDWLSEAKKSSFDRILDALGARQYVTENVAQRIRAIEFVSWAKSTNNCEKLNKEIEHEKSRIEWPVALFFGGVASGLSPLVNWVLFLVSLPDIYESAVRSVLFTAVISCVAVYLYRTWAHSAFLDRIAFIVIGLIVGSLVSLAFPIY